MSDDPRGTLPLYHRGAWTDVPNPLGDWHDWTEAMEAAGYDPSSSAHFGSEFHPLSFDVAQRRTDEHEFADHFFVSVTVESRIHHVLVGDVVDLMDLLKQWLPAVQATSTLELIADLYGDSTRPPFSNVDLLARLGARLAHGEAASALWGAQALRDRGQR